MWPWIAQWAGEDGKPFPPVPKEVWRECWPRYSWQLRHKVSWKERERRLVEYLSKHVYNTAGVV